MFSTLAFSAICLCGAWLVWLHRPGSRAGLTDPGIWIAILLPALASVLFIIGYYEGHGRQLSLTVNELRIPLAEAAKVGTYFIAGPQRDKSDLVVGPYADAQQSQESYREAFDALLTIRRQDGRWSVCGKRVAPDADSNLPGMGIRIGDSTLDGCKPLTSEVSTIGIDRLDVGGDSQNRRSLDITLQNDHVSIVFPPNQALTRHIGKCDGAGDKTLVRLAPVGLHAPDRGYRIPDNLVFEQLGQGGQHPLLKPSALGPINTLRALCEAGPDQLTWPEAESDARLMLSSRTTSLAYWILGLLFLSSLWMWRTAHEYWRDGAGRIEACLVLTLQWLLALRLITAMAGLFNNDALQQASVLWSPAIAFVAVPMMAVAMLRGGQSDARQPILAMIVQMPAALLLIFWGLDWQMPGAQEMILAAVAVGFLIWRRWSDRPEPLLEFGLNLARRMAGYLHKALSKRTAFAKIELNGWTAGLALVIGLVILRGILLLMGFKERVGGLPISMVYIPPLIIGIALLITGYRAVPSLARAFWLVAAFGASLILTGFFVSDFGMIWIFAWPIGWAITALLMVKPLAGRFLGAVSRLLLIGPVLSPLFLAALYYGLYATAVPSPQSDLAGHVEAAAEWDRTAARLQRYVGPDRLIDAGSSASFEMLEQAAQLEPLTGNLIGKGYLAPSGIVMPLLGYQYSDNLLAVHIIWPFGRLGLLAFLASLLCILYTFWRSLGDSITGKGWRGEAGRLAAMIVFWSAAYMALANLNLMPFTGRNAYLLASQSMGDLAEGFLLLLLIVLPLVATVTAPRVEKSGEPQ